MKQRKFISVGLLCTMLVLLTGCTSNDPEKLIVGTWEGVSRVWTDNKTLQQTEVNYETQTYSYYIDGQFQDSTEYPFKETLTLSEDGKLTEVIMEGNEIWSIFEGNYKLEKRGKELWFLCSNEDISMELQVQTLTKHNLVLVSDKVIIDKYDNPGYAITTIHKR